MAQHKKTRKRRYRKKQTNSPKLVYCNQVLVIENILCKIFTFVDFKCLFSRCKLINKLWHHAAKQPQSIEYFSIKDVYNDFFQPEWRVNTNQNHLPHPPADIIKSFRFAKHVSLGKWPYQDPDDKNNVISTNLMHFNKIEHISWTPYPAKFRESTRCLQVFRDLTLKNYFHIRKIDMIRCHIKFVDNGGNACISSTKSKNTDSHMEEPKYNCDKDNHDRKLIFHHLTHLRMYCASGFVFFGDFLQSLILDFVFLGYDELKHLSMSNLSNLETFKLNYIYLLKLAQYELYDKFEQTKQKEIRTMIVDIGNQFKHQKLRHFEFDMFYIDDMGNQQDHKKMYKVKTFLYSLGMQLIDTISTHCKNIDTLKLRTDIHHCNLGIVDDCKTVENYELKLSETEKLNIHNEYGIDKLQFRFNTISSLELQYCSSLTTQQKQAIFDLITKKTESQDSQQSLLIENKLNRVVIIDPMVNANINIESIFTIKELIMSVAEESKKCNGGCEMLTDVLELFTQLHRAQTWYYHSRINSATFKIKIHDWWTNINTEKITQQLEIMARIAPIARNITKHVKFNIALTDFSTQIKHERIIQILQLIQHIKDVCTCWDDNYNYNTMLLDVRMEIHKEVCRAIPKRTDDYHEQLADIWLRSFQAFFRYPSYGFEKIQTLEPEKAPINTSYVFQSKNLNIDDICIKFNDSERKAEILTSVIV